MIALPVSVVASNFTFYNSHAKVKLKLPSRGQKNMVHNALFAPQTSVGVASPDGVNGRSRYSSLVSTGIEMNIINCNKKCPGEENEPLTNHEPDQNRRFARRSAHFSLSHPELPEGDSEPEDIDRANNGNNLQATNSNLPNI